MSATVLDATAPPPTSAPTHHGWVLASLGLFVAAALVLPFVGPGPLDFDRLLAGAEPDWSIFVQLRLSRTLLGLFTGGALALAGTLFQAMLRDALATPYTLGVSTGASLGAVVVLALGIPTVLGIPAVWIGALTGGGLVLVLVVGAAARRGRLSAFGLLLTGIATNSVCSAAIVAIHGLAGPARSFSIARWLLGSLDSVSYAALAPFALFVAGVTIVVLRRGRDWNLLAVGEEWAAARGVPVDRLLLGGSLAGCGLAAASAALSGPIGFVGLIVPHIARARVGADHRILMPCAFLLGGAFLASCDALARSVMAPAELPAGAILALLGGPYLVWLVRQRT